MKKLSVIFILTCIFCLSSCKWLFSSLPQDHFLMIKGKQISNYPKWLHGFDYSCYGFSDWIEWQSDEGKKLHEYVDNSKISDDFDGKFRLLLINQQVKLFFNDKQNTSVTLFHNWLGEKKHYAEKYDYPQNDIENFFEYDCYIKQNLLKDVNNENRSHVKMQKLSFDYNANSYLYKYTQDINGVSIIDIVLINNIRPQGAEVITFEQDSWLPNSIFHEQNDYLLKFDCFNNCYRVFTESFSSFEGISLRTIDKEKREISFNLLDSEKSDFADYFTLKVYKEEERGEIIFYKKKDSVIEEILVLDNYKLFY